MLAVVSIAAASAQAQNATWNGATGDWSTGANWSPNTVPTGTATFNGVGANPITLSTAVSVGTIQINPSSVNYSFGLDAKTLTLTGTGIVDSSAATITFANGPIAGSGGVAQNGAGTLVLSGTDTYSGATTVTTGTLQIDGSISSSVNANSNGALSGTGTVGSTTIMRGVLAPGTSANPTGTLTVNNGITFSSVADYAVTINGNSLSNSAINVNGGVTLSGIFTAIAVPGTANSYSAADAFTVLNATAGIGLTFKGLSTSGSFGNFVPFLTYNANSVVMGLTPGTSWLGATATSGASLWSTTTNWAGGTVPTAAGVTGQPATTVATFGGTPNTSITVNSAAPIGTALFTSGVTSPFNFAINSGGALTFSGAGVDDNSSHPPQFTVGSTTLGGGTLQFNVASSAGDAVITNNSGGATIIGSTSGLDVATAGTATITTNNGGTTTFNSSATGGSATITTNIGGTTTFNANSTAGNATLITNTGGIVEFNGTGPITNASNVSAGAIEGTGGQLLLGSNTLTITAGVPGTSFAGVISGSGGLDIAGGTKTLTTLTGTNTYSGATAINGGTLSVNGSNGSIASSSGIAVNSGGTLTGTGTVSAVTVAAGGTLAPGASGAGTLTVAGNLSLLSGSDYAVTVSNVSGSNTGAAVSGTGKANLAGTLTAVAGGGTYSAADTYTVLSTAAAGGVSGTFSGLNISGSFGNLAPVLSYATGNSVVMDLTAGTLWTGTASGDWNTGGTANWGGSAVPGSTGVAAFNTSTQTTVTVSTPTQIGTMLFYSGADAFTFNVNSTLALNGIGIVDNSGSAPALNVGPSSPATLTFQNAATAGDAAITTYSGSATKFLGNSTGGTAQFVTNSGGVVDFSGTTGPNGNGSITAGSIAGAGNYYLGNTALTVGSNNLSTLVSGVISNCGTGSQCVGNANGSTGGSLIKTGTGTLTLGGVNTFTGMTTINAGTLALSGTSSIATSSGVALTTGATFDISGTTSGASIMSLANSATTQAGTVSLGNKTLTITNGSSTFSGLINGTGGLTIAGGTQTLAGANTYSGATTITGGTLVLTTANAIGDTSGVAVGAGGTLGLGNFVQAIPTVALSGGGTVEGGLLNGTINSKGGTINGIGSTPATATIVNALSGTTTLSGTNTYGGGTTTVSAGATLAGGVANAFSPFSAVTDNGKIDLGSVNQTITLLSGSGTVTNLSNPTGLSGSAAPVLTVLNGGAFSGVVANGAPGGVTTTTGLTVAGGDLTLSGVSTYTGATTITPNGITATTATLTVAGSIATSSGVNVNSGGTLAGTGTVPNVTVTAGGVLAPGNGSAPTAVQTLTIGGNLSLTSGTDYAAAINGSNYSTANVTGTASLAGIFTATPTTAAYSAANSYTVLSTTASNGVSGTFSGLTVSGPGTFGNVAPYLTYAGNSVTLNLTGGTVWTGATSTWNTATNWSGGVVPTGGVTSPTNIATFTNNAASPTVAITPGASAGTMLFTSTAPAYTFNINSGASLALNGVGIDDNSSHPPTFNVGTTGSGTLQFQNAATAGDAVINVTSGSTQFMGNSTPGTAQFTTAAGGTVDFSGTTGPGNNGVITAGSIAGTGGNYELGANQLTLTGAQSSTPVSAIISDCAVGCLGSANGSTGGSLVMAGSGTLMLSGANTYSGGTVLSSGTLNVGVSTNYVTAGTPSSGILNSAIGTGTLIFNGGTLQAGGANFTIANAAQISVAPGAPGGAIDANGQTFTMSGNIADDPSAPGGTLKIINSSATAGIVVFSGANSYSGLTTIGNGAENITLQGGAPDAFSSASIVKVNASATLDLGGYNQAIGGLAGAGTVTNSGTQGGTTSNVAAALTVDGGGIFSGTIENGAGGTAVTGLAMAGSGTTLTLSTATLTYTGSTAINAGTLALKGTSSIATSSGVAISSGGTFDVSQTTTVGTSITTLSGQGNVALGNQALTITNGSTAFSGVIADGGIGGNAGGSLVIAAGTQALAGADTYTGGTTIDSGAILQVGSNGALGTGTLTFNGGGTLQAGANGVSLSNAANLGATGGTFDSHGDTLTWAGAIGGAGALTVIDSIGGGTIVLSGVNGYTGATAVNGGTLSVIGSITASSSVAVNSGGTLSGTGTVTPNVAINNGGTLSPGSTSNPIGTLNIGGSLTMASGANYVTTITGSNALDTSLTSVGGNASLAGTLTLAGSGGTISTNYEILSATGGVSGKFSGINIVGSFGNDLPTLNYSIPNQVQLSLIAGTVWSGATSTDWNTNTNWLGSALPGSTDVAAFDNSTTKNSVSVSAPTQVGTMLFNANAPAYTFTINSAGTLTLTENGIINESTTTTPTFNVAGKLLFSGNSSGGDAQFNALSGGVVDFSGSTGSAGNNVLSAGSIAGSGDYFLGKNQLAVGSNNLSTTFSGVIADGGVGGGTGGSLNKVGTGTLILSGVNTYTGGTTLTAGILQATNNNSIGAGPVTFTGGTFQSNGKNLAFSNTTTLGTGGGTFDTFGNTLSWTGAIGGTGPLNPLNVTSSTGSGTLILSATETYSGATTVNAGTLEVDGSIATSSGVTVNSGGILSGAATLVAGSGTVPSVTVNGGTLSPGSIANPTGTLNISGNLTLTSASYYMIAINGAKVSTTNVSGTAALNGATLLVSATTANIVAGTPYKILTAGTGLTGTLTPQSAYASAVGPVQATVTTFTTSTPNTVTATFSPAQLNASSLPSGFGSFAAAINGLSNAGKLSNTFLGLFNNPTAAAPGVSGLSNTAGVPSLVIMQNSFATTMLDPNMGSRGGAPGGGGSAFGPSLGFAPETAQSPEAQAAYDAVTPHAPLNALMRSLNSDHSYSVWASVYGGLSKFTGDSNTGSQSANLTGGGIASGVDFRFGPDTVVGFALGGGYTNWNVSSGLGGGNSDIFQAGVYGSHRFGDFYVSGALAYALDGMNINRNITSPAPANLTANFNANGFTGRIEGGYRYGSQELNLTPYIAANYSAISLPSYSENTASGTPGFALAYASETASNERAELGLWGNIGFRAGDDAAMRLSARLGYAHDWWSNDSFNANFVGLPTQGFSLTGITPPSNLALATLNSEIRYANGMSFGLKLDGEVGSGAYSLAGTGTFRYSW